MARRRACWGLNQRELPAEVFNIEVDGDHVYSVGEQGLLVHNMSANPSIIPDPANTPAHYAATDCTNPQLGINGTLKGGVLKFDIVTVLPGNIRGAVSGKEFFAAMMDYFGVGNITTIRGVWISGADLDTNIDDFNKFVLSGSSDTDAAKKTWTGMRANDYGFVNASIDFKDPPKGPPPYIEVHARFTK